MSFLFTLLLSAVVIYLGYYFNMLWVSVLVAIVLFVVMSSSPKQKPSQRVSVKNAQQPIQVIINETGARPGSSKYNPLYIHKEKKISWSDAINKTLFLGLGYASKCVWKALKALLGHGEGEKKK